MDGQRQQPYVPGAPATQSQSHMMLPPPPPRYQPSQPLPQASSQPQGVPPPPPGPPPVAGYNASKPPHYWRGMPPYLPPPPPPPMSRTNQTSFHPSALQSTSGIGPTYVPSANTFGPGVGIPGFDLLPSYDPQPQPTLAPSERPRPPHNPPYAHTGADPPGYKRDGSIPPTPSGRNVSSSLAFNDSTHDLVLSNNPVSQNAELTKSSSHRHNNSNSAVGGLSANEAAAQWPLERVLLWLARNGFSHEWQSAFKALELQGTDFLELGHGINGRPTPGKLHNVVYPQLAKEYEASGTSWDFARDHAREEGKRMRKLIRQIQDDAAYEIAIPLQKQADDLQGSAPDEGSEPSPNLTHIPASPHPTSTNVANSPNLKAPKLAYNRNSMQLRSVTMPVSSSHDNMSPDYATGDASTIVPRSSLTQQVLAGIASDYQRKSPSLSSDNGTFAAPVRPFEESPKSGSPATQHATLAYSGPSSSSGDLHARFGHSRGNSAESTRRYYESFKPGHSPQEMSSRQLGGENSSYPKDHRMGIFHLFSRRKNRHENPSPEDQFAESQLSESPIYDKQHFNNSDLSVNERPVSASTSDFERLAARGRLSQRGKKFIFATTDGWNYRLIDTTDIDSAETLRVAICQNLGIQDWPDAQIFLTEPGHTEHDEPLNDSFLILCQRTKSDAAGSLKLLVRGSHSRPGANNSPRFVGTGLGVLIPEKPTVSPTSGVPPRKKLDAEAIHRISPNTQTKPNSPQQLKAPAVKFTPRDPPQSVGLSPVDGEIEGYAIDEAALARRDDQKREADRKQQMDNRIPTALQQRPDLYSETGYRRKEVINFDQRRVSPYDDKKSDGLVPFRKPPMAPPDSHTLTKVNSLRKKDTDRPRVQPSTHNGGVMRAFAEIGRMTGTVGRPPSTPGSGNTDEPRSAFEYTTQQSTQTTPSFNSTWSPGNVTASPTQSNKSPSQSRKSYGPEVDFVEPEVSFQRSGEQEVSFQRSPIPEQDSDSDDDSDGGLFAIPLANSKTPVKEKGPVPGSPEDQQRPRKPSLTVNTETKLRSGLSVSFRSPSASRETFANSSGDPINRAGSSFFDMSTSSPEDEKPPPRRDSFARGDIWASRPPVEGVINNLDDFFPNIDLDAPYLDGQGASPPTSPASRLATENDYTHRERQDSQPYTTPPHPASNENIFGSAEPTIKPQDHGIVARRNINRAGGGLTRGKSIREVARGANQASRNRSVAASSGNQGILRRKSTKMFGAKIMQISPKPGARLSQLDPIPQNNTPSATLPQRQPTFRIIRGQLIGKGTYGRVYLGMNADNGEVLAVKQVEINPRIAGQDKDRIKEMVAAMDQEIDTMQHLEHPNIVQYLGCERGEFSISIYLEYISGGSVGSCLRKHGKFEESVVKSLTRQTLDGLSYLHRQGILHRDLKADNILLDLDGSCKISDFGISKKTDNIYGNDSTNSMQGTVFWMAPEVIQSQGQGYSAKVDIWSLGCVVLEMFAGRRPWSKEEAIGAIYKLGSLSQAPPIPEDVSVNITPSALGFMYDCFTVDPGDRPTAETLLTHPFCEPEPKYNFQDTELYAKIQHVLDS